jgi:hypothetical protein
MRMRSGGGACRSPRSRSSQNYWASLSRNSPAKSQGPRSGDRRRSCNSRSSASSNCQNSAASRSQSVTLKPSRGQNIKFLPYAFTEHGAIMAATVLNSPRAVEMSIYVVRAFVHHVLPSRSPERKPLDIDQHLGGLMDLRMQGLQRVLNRTQSSTFHIPLQLGTGLIQGANGPRSCWRSSSNAAMSMPILRSSSSFLVSLWIHQPAWPVAFLTCSLYRSNPKSSSRPGPRPKPRPRPRERSKACCCSNARSRAFLGIQSFALELLLHSGVRLSPLELDLLEVELLWRCGLRSWDRFGLKFHPVFCRSLCFCRRRRRSFLSHLRPQLEPILPPLPTDFLEAHGLAALLRVLTLLPPLFAAGPPDLLQCRLRRRRRVNSGGHRRR